jgi:hypothetical protein
MARKFVLKVAIASLLCVALFVFSLPIGLYWFGLSKIEGRPEPPTQTNNTAADTALLLQDFRSQAPIAVHALNPWTYVITLLTERADDLRMDPGSHAIWLIARDYNYKHIKDRKMSHWHLSGAALSIWLSRNWTTDEIVTTAAAIVRSYRPPFNSSSLKEVRQPDDLPEGLKFVLRQGRYAGSGEGPEGRCCVFLVGGIAETSALVAYEIFGFVPTYRANAFVQSKAGWVTAGEWTIGAASTLEELKEMTSRPP